LDFKRLHYFMRIAELGSLSRAADALRIAQPSLSRQMRLLEEELGAPLFARHRRGMQLTDAGKELRVRLVAPLRQIEHALNDIRSQPSARGGSVALGVPPTAVGALAGPLARRVAADGSNIELRIVEAQSEHLVDGLQRGELDLAVLHGSTPGYELNLKDLMVEQLMLVGRSDRALSPEEPVDFEMLGELPLVLPGRPHGLRAAVEDAAARHKIRLNVLMQADSLQLLKEFVEQGVGYAVLPSSAVVRETEAGRLRYAPIRNPALTRRLALAVHPACQSPRAAARVEGLLRQELIALVGAGKWAGWLLFEPLEF
jgi:DNA-binding transcriptional LysR family regulator